VVRPRFQLSVIIPVYNAETTVRRTFASLDRISSDGRRAVQIVVVDDGSADHSLQRIRHFEQSAVDFRLTVVEQTNEGVSSARNAALDVAQGEWVFFLDSDDELAFDPMPYLLSAESHTCCGFGIDYHREERRIRRVPPALITPENWADVLTARNPFQPSSLIFRRHLIAHSFNTDVAFAEDWLFWMENNTIFGNMRVFPDTVSARVHIHEGNTSSHYAKAGKHRVLVAEIAESVFGPQFTTRQRNNLCIQRHIGKLQQRQWISPTTFFRFPCDPLLYAKLWVYAASAAVGCQATPFRQSARSARGRESQPLLEARHRTVK
jgi:glycosyltransferase involved in cell wall biosynthesis